MCVCRRRNFAGAWGTRSRKYHNMNNYDSCIRAVSLRSSGGPAVQGHAEVVGEEKPARFFPRLPTLTARDDGQRRRSFRAQIRIRMSRKGGGNGERAVAGPIACLYKIIPCMLVVLFVCFNCVRPMLACIPSGCCRRALHSGAAPFFFVFPCLWFGTVMSGLPLGLCLRQC